MSSTSSDVADDEGEDGFSPAGGDADAEAETPARATPRSAKRLSGRECSFGFDIVFDVRCLSCSK